MLGVFLDFNKAFDTVGHHTLLNKMYKYGISINGWKLICLIDVNLFYSNMLNLNIPMLYAECHKAL